MTFDIDKLNAGLESLTGRELENLERIARSMGETMPEITISKKFQALAAAKALGMKYDDILDLPAKQYIQITLAVFNFFFEDMVPEKKTEDQSEASQVTIEK